MTMKKRHKRQKKTVSLVKSITCITVWVIGFILAAAFLSGLFFYRKINEGLIQEKTGQAELRINDMDNTVSRCRGILQELWLQALNEEGFTNSNQLRKYTAKRSLYASFVKYIGDNPAISTLFFTDAGNQISLICTNAAGDKRLAVLELLHSEELKASSYRTAAWNYIYCAGENYCYLKYYVNDSEIGMLISINSLLDSFAAFFSAEEESFEIFTGEERILAGNGISNGGFTGRQHESKVLERAIADTPLTLRYYYHPQWRSYLLDSAAVSSFLVFLPGLVLCVILSLFLRCYLVHPLNGILSVMRQIEAGDTCVRAGRELNSSEMKNLADTFNHMLDEITALKIREYEQKLREQEDKLRLLRSQLRPHFYLNALNTVNSMTYQGDESRIREYLYVLSAHVRYMMKIDDELITLGEEIGNIEAYIRLQEFRCSCDFTYYIDCAQELREQKIPYLLLYTLVENVFKHGIRSNDSFFLLLECRMQKDGAFAGLQILLEDNGPGFTEEFLEQYRQHRIRESERSRIGLKNVQQTLKLRYGRSDLLRLENTATGARVEVRIPNEAADCG